MFTLSSGFWQLIKNNLAKAFSDNNESWMSQLIFIYTHTIICCVSKEICCVLKSLLKNFNTLKNCNNFILKSWIIL